LPGWPRNVRRRSGRVSAQREGAERNGSVTVGDLLRCGRPGGSVATVRRNPSLLRRLPVTHCRRSHRPEGLGEGPRILRGEPSAGSVIDGAGRHFKFCCLVFNDPSVSSISSTSGNSTFSALLAATRAPAWRTISDSTPSTVVGIVVNAIRIS